MSNGLSMTANRGYLIASYPLVFEEGVDCIADRLAKRCVSGAEVINVVLSRLAEYQKGCS